MTLLILHRFCQGLIAYPERTVRVRTLRPFTVIAALMIGGLIGMSGTNPPAQTKTGADQQLHDYLRMHNPDDAAGSPHASDFATTDPFRAKFHVYDIAWSQGCIPVPDAAVQGDLLLIAHQNWHHREVSRRHPGIVDHEGGTHG